MGLKDTLKRFGRKIASATGKGLAFGVKAGNEIKRIGIKVGSAVAKSVDMADALGLGNLLDKSGARKIADKTMRASKIATKIGGGVSAVGGAGQGMMRVGRDIVKEGITNSDNIQRLQDVKRYARTVGGAGTNVIGQARAFNNAIAYSPN